MEDVDKQYCDKPESVRPMHVGDGRVMINMDNIRPFQGGSRKRKSRKRKSLKRKSRRRKSRKSRRRKKNKYIPILLVYIYYILCNINLITFLYHGLKMCIFFDKSLYCIHLTISFSYSPFL